jgi:3-isopropylmalate dehydrogenase
VAKNYKIAVLPGDGIGPEVMDQARRVLGKVSDIYGFTLEMTDGLIGGAAYDASGDPLPQQTIDLCKASDAVFLGSVGGPKWDNLPPEKRPELGGLLKIRKSLDLFANLRPVKTWPGLEQFCPLAEATAKKGYDIMTVRELSSGIYFSQPKERTEDYGLDTMIYRRNEVDRIVRKAFEIAGGRSGKVTSVDKANVLYSSILWREVTKEIAADYKNITLEHMYVDNAAMQLILKPSQFDVIVTTNLFGDILSDEAAALAGSLGMLPSASLGTSVHLYEPAGGSAPDIAGKGIANPIAQILSGAMMLDYSFSESAAAKAIWTAVEAALNSGLRTGDIAAGSPSVGTVAMTDAIIANLK